MASQPYISPYLPDERTRRSVMAAQAFNKSIAEVFEHDARIKPRFDEDSFSGALGTITLIVEGLCVEGGEGWYERQIIVPEVPRISERLFWGASSAPIEGNDRAVCDSSSMGSWLLSWKYGGFELRDVLSWWRSFLLLTSVL